MKKIAIVCKKAQTAKQIVKAISVKTGETIRVIQGAGGQPVRYELNNGDAFFWICTVANARGKYFDAAYIEDVYNSDPLLLVSAEVKTRMSGGKIIYFDDYDYLRDKNWTEEEIEQRLREELDYKY